MAKHEFGIMTDAPQSGKRYDEYEPRKYDCISVDDDYVEGIAEKLGFIDFYWHTLSIKEKGLAYYGISLIPPCSLKAFIDVIDDIPELYELKGLLEKALSQKQMGYSLWTLMERQILSCRAKIEFGTRCHI